MKGRYINDDPIKKGRVHRRSSSRVVGTVGGIWKKRGDTWVGDNMMEAMTPPPSPPTPIFDGVRDRNTINAKGERGHDDCTHIIQGCIQNIWLGFLYVVLVLLHIWQYWQRFGGPGGGAIIPGIGKGGGRCSNEDGYPLEEGGGGWLDWSNPW